MENIEQLEKTEDENCEISNDSDCEEVVDILQESQQRMSEINEHVESVD